MAEDKATKTSRGMAGNPQDAGECRNGDVRCYVPAEWSGVLCRQP